MTEINMIMDGFNIGFNITKERIYKVKARPKNVYLEWKPDKKRIQKIKNKKDMVKSSNIVKLVSQIGNRKGMGQK